MSADDLDIAYRRLVSALVLAAIEDSEHGDAEATSWLVSQDAREWLSDIGISEKKIAAWLSKL